MRIKLHYSTTQHSRTPLRGASLRWQAFSFAVAVATAALAFPGGSVRAQSDSEVPLKPPPPEPFLARLGDVPDWSRLDVYQRTITRQEFERLLNHCYSRDPDVYKGLIQILPDRARILRQSTHEGAGWYDLYFLTDRRKTVKIERYWRPSWQIDRRPANDNKPLTGIHIVIDPGHIGGRWADVEDRYYKIGENTIPVQEGDLTLQTAKLLEKNLVALGARVTLTRTETEPVTDEREADLLDEARDWIRQTSGNALAPAALVKRTANRMFYVSSELRARSKLINQELKPDLVLCLHFDAAPWLNPYKPAFRDKNHLHLMINGCYSPEEMREDDTRFEMLLRLLQRTYYYELSMAEAISKTMKQETRLPAFRYDGKNGKSVNGNSFVWARNLLANRKYMCPVVFFEPYCMNNRQVHARIQAGTYDGLKEFDGQFRKNIFQEYADGATAGLVNYFRKVR